MFRRSHLLIAQIAIVAVGLLTACNNPHLSGGKLHFDQDRFERALGEFEIAVNDIPESGEARLWLGRAHAELDHPVEAAENFDKALELDERIAADVKNTREHYWSELYNSGIAFTDQAKENKSQGATAAAEENFRKALVDFKKAVIYNPESHTTRTNIGATYFNLGKIDSALAIFDEVHQMAPENEELNIMLMSVYKDQGNRAFNAGLDAKRLEEDNAKAAEMFTAARDFYAQAFAIDSEDIDLNHNRGAVFWELADLSEDPDEKSAYRDQALAAYKSVLEDESDNVDVMLNLSILYGELDRYEDALELSSRLVDIDPKNARYHKNQGQMQGKLGNKTKMFGDLLIGQSLDQGTLVPVEQARAQAEAHGPRSDQLSRFREGGPPEEIRVYTDAGGGKYEVWFYWSRGGCYAFLDGKDIYAKRFKKWVEEVPEEGGAADE